MTYQINARDDGQYDLVVMRPTIVGTLASKRMAERFASWLETMDEEELEQLSAFQADEPMPAPDAPALVAETDDSPAEQAGLPVLETQQPDPRPSAPADAAPDRIPSTEVLHAAFARIASGENLTTVADDIGMSMFKLRSRYARHRRDTPAQSDDKVDCVTCGRPHKPSAAGDGLCARCARDMGRA